MSRSGAPVEGSRVIGAAALEGRVVEEVADGVLLRHPSWERHRPGLVAGITSAEAGTFSVSSSTGEQLHEAFAGLGESLGFRRVIVPLQVHGREVVRVPRGTAAPESGSGTWVTIAGRVDGLVTAGRGILLASTAADCVPVYLADTRAGVIGLAHAGWRGVAGGILSRAIDAAVAAGARTDLLRLHLGPAICGACYEVDRPVLEALELGGERALVDLRGVLVEQARQSGIGDARISVSGHCTSCASPALHSHRAAGAQAGRMAAFTGMRLD